MSIYFDRLQRDPRFRKKEEAPAANSALGDAIEAIIRQQVEERVATELEKQRPLPNPRVPFHRREFTNTPEQHEFPAPPPTTKPPMPIITMTRDAAGRIKQAHVGRLTFTVERDGADRAVRLVPQED